MSYPTLRFEAEQPRMPFHVYREGRSLLGDVEAVDPQEAWTLAQAQFGLNASQFADTILALDTAWHFGRYNVYAESTTQDGKVSFRSLGSILARNNADHNKLANELFADCLVEGETMKQYRCADYPDDSYLYQLALD